MPSPTIKGLTTIFWGTNNSVNTPAGAIIESMRVTPKNGAPIEIEDNNGFAAAAVILDDGFDAAATCLWDSNKTWPNVADNVSLAIPYPPNTTKTFANCFIGATPEIDLARKREATIAFKIVYRPGIVP